MRNVILAAALLLPLSALAQTAKPPELAPYIHAAAPYGQGTLNKLWIHAYDAQLWTDAKPWSMDKEYALSLRYGHDFDGGRIADRSIDEMRHDGSLPKEQEESYRKQLTAIFPDVKDGDIITALYQPDKGVTFFYNGKACGAITDKQFAKRFMGIWLSPATSEPELHGALLSLHSQRD